MDVNAKDVSSILEHLALQSAADSGAQGLDHGSTICRLPVKSWQADIIRKTPNMPQALNPAELRRAIQDPEVTVIFVPEEAIVTRDVIDRICVENSLRKMIVWETD